MKIPGLGLRRMHSGSTPGRGRRSRAAAAPSFRNTLKTAPSRRAAAGPQGSDRARRAGRRGPPPPPGRPRALAAQHNPARLQAGRRDLPQAPAPGRKRHKGKCVSRAPSCTPGNGQLRPPQPRARPQTGRAIGDPPTISPSPTRAGVPPTRPPCSPYLATAYPEGQAQLRSPGLQP